MKRMRISPDDERSREVTRSRRDRTASGGDITHSEPPTVLQRLGNQTVKRLYEPSRLQAKVYGDAQRRPTKRAAETVSQGHSAGRVAMRGPSFRAGEDDRAVSSRTESVIRDGVSGSDTLLSSETRIAFENRLGADFSNVRIHRDSAADDAARAMNAEAFTFGADIAFAAGRYDPDSSAGSALLAHELAHVIQQRRGTRLTIQCQAGEWDREAFNELKSRLTPAEEWSNFWEWDPDRRERELRDVRYVHNRITSSESMRDSWSRELRLARLKHLPSPEETATGVGGYMPYEGNVEEFKAFFRERMPEDISFEPEDLLISSTDLAAANRRRTEPYRELPPRDLWENLPPTLDLLGRLERASGANLEMHSSYRSEHINTLAAGAPSSAHRRFIGVDVKPTENVQRFGALVRWYFHQRGDERNMGLGYYRPTRIHVDVDARDRRTTWTSETVGTEAEARRVYEQHFDRPLSEVLSE